MKVLLQRVAYASVEVDGYVESRIGTGLVLFIGVKHGDTVQKARQLASKVVKLPLWPELENLDKKWASSVQDNGFEILLVLQQSICASFPQGKFSDGAAQTISAAKPIFQAFKEELGKLYQPEMVVAATISDDCRVDLTAECPGVFELDSDESPSAGLPNGNTAAIARSSSGELQPDVVSVTQVLKELVHLPRVKATHEATVAFRVFGMKKFRTALAEAGADDVDKFVEAVNGAGKYFNARQQELINDWLTLSLSGSVGDEDEGDQDHADVDSGHGRERPDWSGHAAPRTPGTVGGRWAGKAGKGKGKAGVRTHGHGILSIDGAAALHGTGSAGWGTGQLQRFSDKQIRFEEVGSAGKRAAAEPHHRIKFQKGTPTLAPMTPAPKSKSNSDEI